MTTQVDPMPAGREMDALFWLVLNGKPPDLLLTCRHVDGDVQPHAGYPLGHISPPDYSTNLHLLIQTMKSLDFWWSASYKEPAQINDKLQAAYFVTFRCIRGGTNRGTHTAFALELPHAACLAALKAMKAVRDSTSSL